MPAATKKKVGKLDPAALSKVVAEHANNCRVKAFMDGDMDAESRLVLERALAMDSRKLSSTAILDMLDNAGYEYGELLNANAIKLHRQRKGSCRCPTNQ